MRKFLYTILSVGLLFVVSETATAQCNPESLTKDCIPKLADGFNYLKSYKINGQSGAKDKVEYSYVFTKGTQYMINLCAPGESTDGIIVNLYDRKRNKVVSSKVD